LPDGQFRFDTSSSTASNASTLCFNPNTHYLTDTDATTTNRVCLSEPGNTQFQCDLNVNSTIFGNYGSSFSLDDSHKMLQWKNSTSFFACPIDAGKAVWNAYTTSIDAACAEIVLGIEAVEFCPVATATATTAVMSSVGSKTTLTLTVPHGRGTVSSTSGIATVSIGGVVQGNAAVGMRDGAVRRSWLVVLTVAVMATGAFVS